MLCYAAMLCYAVLCEGSFDADTVIAIKAPSGTTLEVPDPDEGMEYPQRRYPIYPKSAAGPIEVFLVRQVHSI